MSIDSMRVGGGRCPPLLVIGLIIACIMMVCNWWTLSSTNLELLRQIDELNEQIKISVEERDQCVTQHGDLETQFKTCQDNARTAQVKYSQVDDTLSTCNKELKSYKQFDISKTATLDVLRLEKKTLESQLDMVNKKKKKLEEDLNKSKDDLEKLTEKLKLSMNASPPKQTPAIPIAHLLGKPESDNKTAVNVAPNAQVNPPPNAANEPQGRDFQDKDNSNIKDDNNAAEVDGINAIDSDLNFNLMSDPKVIHDTK